MIPGKCIMRTYIIYMYCTLPLNTGLSRKTKWDADISYTEQMIWTVLIQVSEPKKKRPLKKIKARLQHNIKTELNETGYDEDCIKTGRGVL
jgi:hypothetical protein